MAITIQDQDINNCTLTSSAKTLTIDTSNANALVVCLANLVSTDITAWTVTFNGTSIAPNVGTALQDATNKHRMTMYAVMNPPKGSYTLSVTPDTEDHFGFIGLALSGVGSFRTSATAVAASTTHTVTATTVAGDLVIWGLNGRQTAVTDFTAVSGETLLLEHDNGSIHVVAWKETATGTSTTTSATTAASRFSASVALPLVPCAPMPVMLSHHRRHRI